MVLGTAEEVGGVIVCEQDVAAPDHRRRREDGPDARSGPARGGVHRRDDQRRPGGFREGFGRLIRSPDRRLDAPRAQWSSDRAGPAGGGGTYTRLDADRPRPSGGPGGRAGLGCRRLPSKTLRPPRAPGPREGTHQEAERGRRRDRGGDPGWRYNAGPNP